MRDMNLNLMIYLIVSSFAVAVSSLPWEHWVLVNCLISGGVRNFSVGDNPPSAFSRGYDLFFQFSLQNLLFQSPSKKPAAIILPADENQLVKSYECSRVGHHYGVRIRSGGHSNEGLSTVIDDGKSYVIIDLMNFNKVVVDAEAKIATVEAGATLGELYYAIWEQSKTKTLAFPGGVCPTVGSGGHISGGGYGFLARTYGLAADHVEDFNLITPKPEILTRSTMDEDVFWAVRGGGGGSFGIVSKWKINLVDVPEKVTYFRISKSGDKLPLLIHKWQEVAPSLEKTFQLAVELKTDKKKYEGRPYAVFQGLYQGPKSEAFSILQKEFPTLEIVEEELKYINWIDAVTSLGNLRGAPEGLKNRDNKSKKYYKAKTDYVKEHTISIQGVKGMIEKVAEQPMGVIRLWPYGGMMDEISSHFIPFPHRKGTLYFIMYEVRWGEKDNEKSDDYLNWVRDIYKYMTQFVSSNPRGAFVNYVDHELGEHWGAQYFGSTNCQRLVKAKKVIDPSNVFHHPLGIALDDKICNPPRPYLPM